MPLRPPVRQGTSRMVPVVVSAGLAVGVFCGLLFGLGTGSGNAGPTTPVRNGAKPTEDPAPPESVKSSGNTPTPSPVNAGSNPGPAVAAGGRGSGSAAAAGSNTASE